MAFFEQLGKKLTDAGQNVAQQTKNLTDITRLNASISDKEKQIAQLYSAIGAAYYDRHKDDSLAEEQEQIAQINALFAEIANCKDEIDQIKGAGKCPACGATVSPNALFCNSCGTKLEQSAAEPEVDADVQLCPNCNQPVTPGNRFCNHCGSKLMD